MGSFAKEMVNLNAHYSVLWGIYGLTRSVRSGFLQQLDLKNKYLYRLGINGLKQKTASAHL